MTQPSISIPSSGYPVQCRNLVYHPPHQPHRKILDDITFDVKAGEFVGIVGENGAGKSTLLGAIAGELISTSGEVEVAGQRIDRPINRRIDDVGIVHQLADLDFVEQESIVRNVAFRQHNNGCHPGRFWACSVQYRAKVAADLSKFAPKLQEDVEKLVMYLSGGGRQILSLAIAIHLEHRERRCRLLLLDEHTAGLDHKNAQAVMQYTVDQAREVGTSVLMATHRHEDVIQHCDKVIILRKGRAVGPLPVGDVATVDALRRIIETGEPTDTGTESHG